MPRLLLGYLLAVHAVAWSAPVSATGAPLADDGATPLQERCAQVRIGMNYREAVALMGRPPDNTLSGHSAAGPDGTPPAGSYAIDFWEGVDAQGRSRVCSLRSSGGVVESIDCGGVQPASPTGFPET